MRRKLFSQFNVSGIGNIDMHGNLIQLCLGHFWFSVEPTLNGCYMMLCSSGKAQVANARGQNAMYDHVAAAASSAESVHTLPRSPETLHSSPESVRSRARSCRNWFCLACKRSATRMNWSYWKGCWPRARRDRLRERFLKQKLRVQRRAKSKGSSVANQPQCAPQVFIRPPAWLMKAEGHQATERDNCVHQAGGAMRDASKLGCARAQQRQAEDEREDLARRRSS